MIALLVALLVIASVESQVPQVKVSLPGVAPHSFEKGDEVSIWLLIAVFLHFSPLFLSDF